MAKTGATDHIGMVIKDDNAALDVADVLENLGWSKENIIVARNRADAKGAIEACISAGREIKIAIVDPGLDRNKPDVWEGFDCIREIRGGYKDCHIICLTNSRPPPDDEGRHNLAMEAGANAFISTWSSENWVETLDGEIRIASGAET